MRIFFIISILTLCSCNQTNEKNSLSTYQDQLEIIDTRKTEHEPGDPICPKNHSDSIIPIIYGFPSEELFEQEDSGLVWLGGCEVWDEAPTWHCKIHQLDF